jgi:hypothetical protein
MIRSHPAVFLLLLFLLVVVVEAAMAGYHHNNNNKNRVPGRQLQREDGGGALPVQQPQQQQDGPLYFCDDPTDQAYVLECDEDTGRWNLELLDPEENVDDSDACDELIQILREARDDVPLYQEIMDNVVTDRLKPCVLWATLYGPLRQEDDDPENGFGTIVPNKGTTPTCRRRQRQRRTATNNSMSH